MVEITLQVDGDDALRQAFAKLEQSLRDLSKPLEKAGDVFYTFEKDAFDSEGASSAAGRWSPLTRQYARWKEAVAPGKPILELSGAMRDAMTGPDSPDSYRRISPNEIAIGTTLEYPKFHQTGTARMVARQVIALTKEQETQLVNVVKDGMREILKDAGFEVEGL